MTSFTIIGTGTMAHAIGGILADGGSTVTYVAHDAVGTEPLGGDVVILAVPFAALDSIVRAYGSELDGRVLVDITNPVDFATFDGLVVPADSSAAAELAAKVPGARVLKAFNTSFAATLVSKRTGDRPTTVLVAGDDADGKAVLVDALVAGGVQAVDAGSLRRARELEAIGFLQMTLAAAEKTAWTAGFSLES
jgi:predicted dinucleotide-binding enzyme